MTDTVKINDLLLCSPERGDRVIGPRDLAQALAVQVSHPIRGKRQVYRSRGGSGLTLSFTVSRTWSSLSAAWTYVQDHPGQLAALSLAKPLKMEWRYGGGGLSVRLYDDIALQSATHIYRGHTTEHTYTILYSEVSTSTN
jgi:hypothetical protein